MLSLTKHMVNLTWTVVNGTSTNPTISNPDVYIGGLHFIYEVEPNNVANQALHKMFLKLADDAENFDHHWSITIQNNQGLTRTFSATTQRIQFYIFPSGRVSVEDEWTLLELDVHAYRKSFHNELDATKSGNTYRIELTADGGVVWVNREFLGLNSEYFRDQLRRNSKKLQLAEVTTEDFLDYVYCVHPPALKMTLARVGRIWELAKCFQNKALILSCEMFLECFRPNNSPKRCKLLIEADRLGLEQVFTRAVNSLTPADLKELDISAVPRFSPSNLQQFLEVWSILKAPARERQAESGFSQFLDIDKARQWNYDCTILIEGSESSPIYAKKAILATNSKYFKTLFFGDFKETNSDTVTLKELNFQGFLEYLGSVYAPSPLLAATKAATILRLADRFQNELLFKHCADFLLQNGEFSTKEKLDTLFLADEFNLEKLFEATFARLSRDDLRDMDFQTVTSFRPAMLRLCLDRCLQHQK